MGKVMIDSTIKNSLVRISGLQGQVPPVIDKYRHYVEEVLRWSREYLCQPHPQLGRKGPVCPFVAKAMQKDLYFMSVYDKASLDEDEVGNLMLAYRDIFLETQPVDGPDAIFKCILVLFPNLPLEQAPKIIDQTQSTLITKFTPHKMMIGEFHPGPPKKVGLWNDTFQPLFCPVPMLVIRHMVNTDILFLQHNRANTISWLKFFNNPADIPKKFHQYANDAIKRFGLDHPLYTSDEVAPDQIEMENKVIDKVEDKVSVRIG